MTKITPDLPEDLEDKLLADWVKGLPDPPPGLVNNTLDKLRNAPTVGPEARPAPHWNRLVLGGMVAFVTLVVVSLVIFTLLNSPTLQDSQNPTAVSQVLTVTPGVNPTPGPAQTAVQIAAQTVAATVAPLPTVTNAPAAPNVPATVTSAPVVQNSPQSQVDATTAAVSSTPSVTTFAETASANDQPTVSFSHTVTPTDEPVLPTVPPALPTFTLKPKPQPTATATPVPPTATPSGPATPIVGVYTIPASASPAANRTFSGQIKTLTASSLTLSNLTNVFILNAATKVRVNGQASAVSALKVGDNVVIQAVFNAQGELVAQDISTTTKNLPKPITLPGSGD